MRKYKTIYQTWNQLLETGENPEILDLSNQAALFKLRPTRLSPIAARVGLNLSADAAKTAVSGYSSHGAKRLPAMYSPHV
jgi:hypothetical protein